MLGWPNRSEDFSSLWFVMATPEAIDGPVSIGKNVLEGILIAVRRSKEACDPISLLFPIEIHRAETLNL